MAKVVLVTGVSRYLGGAFARMLTSQSGQHGIEQVIGVDIVPPRHDLGSARFVRADIRGPMIGRLMAQAEVDTVVHLGVIATPVAAGGRASQKDINVLGTMQLLAACQKAESLQRLVVKSSAAVYGSSPRDPAIFTEDMGPGSQPRRGFSKDSVEVEGYVRSLARRRPDLLVTTLRMASVVGPEIRTGVTDYFSLPVIPTPAGFCARLQFLHEADAIAALVRATTGDHPGTFNVAGDGVVTVQQAAAIAGRPRLPVPLVTTGLVGRLMNSPGMADFSADQMDYLAYGRCMDTERMRSELGFEPAYTSRGAFEDFVTHALRGLREHSAMTAIVGAVDGAAELAAGALTGATAGVARLAGSGR